MPWFRMTQSRRPKAVEAAKGGDGSSDEGCAVFRSEERLLDGAAELGASAFGDEGVGLLRGGAVAEDNPGASLAKEADGGGTDAAGASGNESDFALERHGDA